MADDIYNVFQDLARMQAEGASDEAVPSYPVPPAMMADMRRRAAMYGAGSGDVPEGDIPVSYGAPVGPVAGGPSIPNAPTAAPAAAALEQGQFGYGALVKLAMEQAKQREARQQAMLEEMKAQEAKYGEPYKMSNLDQAAALAKITGALLSPTRTGSFMESIGAAGTAAAGPLSEAAKAERERQDKLRQLQMARQKMALEMETGVPFDQMMKLEQLRLAAEKADKLDLETIELPDGTKMTVQKKNGKLYDLEDRPLDISKLYGDAARAPERDRQNLSVELGVPLLKDDPFSNIPNARDREKARTSAMAADQKRFDKTTEGYSDSDVRGEIRKFNRFVQLNEDNTKTGGMWRFTPDWSSTAEQMKSISGQMAISAGKDLKGAASDRDVAMFKGTTVGTDKRPETNRNIALFEIESRKNELERRQFMRDYLRVNRTLTGADREWSEYLNANPIFVYPEKGSAEIETLKPNPNRVRYEEYFARRNKGGGARKVIRGPNGELTEE